MLYQRYFLRMNQSNTTHILSLLLALVLSLAAVQIILIPMESATSQTHRNTLQRNRYNDEVNSNASNISPSLNRTHNNITNYTLNANSQQNFVRLNYNYSTENETGNWLFCRSEFYGSPAVRCWWAIVMSHMRTTTTFTNSTGCRRGKSNL